MTSGKVEVLYLPEVKKAKIVLHDNGSNRWSFTIEPKIWNKLVVDTTIMMEKENKNAQV